MPSAQRARWKQDATQPLVCTRGPDCDAKWNRALKWVQDNADSSIDIANETIITTKTPITWSSPVFSITKTEEESGTYAINFRAGCSWILPCEPSILELKASFANYVMKSTDITPVTKTQGDRRTVIARPKANLGAVTVKTSQAAATRLGMKEPEGARIIHIGPKGSAFDAGLRIDDVILRFGDRPIRNNQELDSVLEDTTPPKTVPVTVWRAGAGELVISVVF
jgi:hypothetical protein